MEFPEPHGNDGGIAARSSRITSRYGKSGLMMLDVFFLKVKCTMLLHLDLQGV